MFYAFNIRKFYKFIFNIFALLILIFLIFKLTSFFIPLKYESIIDKYSNKYSVNKALIFAVINTESNFDINAVSIKGASGLMQLMEQTANWLAENNNVQEFDFNKDIFNPDLNIKLGVIYLRQLLDMYNNNEISALAAYNAGIGNVSKWTKNKEYYDGQNLINIPFKETKSYIKKVQFYKKIYELIFKVRKIFSN